MKNEKFYTKSSSFYIAVAFSFTLLIVFSVLGYFTYVVANTEFIKQARSAITSDGFQFKRWHDAGGINTVIDKINLRMERGTDQVYLLVDRQNNKVAGMLQTWPNIKSSEFFDMQAVELADNEIDQSWHRPPFIQYETIQIFTQTVKFDDGYQLLIGRNLYDIERLRDLSGELALFALVILGLIVIVNFVISLFVVNRVNHIANVTRHVTETGDLSSRITISGGWDDLSYLARAINSLMNYIEKLVENIKQVSDNIAHDLRSPLTRLQNHIDSLDETKPLNAKEKAKLKAESETLLSMFASILRISEIESGKHVFERRAYNVKKLLSDVVEFFEPVASEKGISINKHIEEVEYPIDKDLIFQAMLNLLENAIKFTPAEGQIDVSVSLDSHNQLQISVADSGIGIPEPDRQKVFRRFYRTDKSRTHPGNGLGLSMVKAIVDFHSGRIDLHDNEPGLYVQIILPRQTEY